LTSLSEDDLIAIFNYLNHPREQIAFALSCRKIAAAVGQREPMLKPGIVRVHRYPRHYGKESLLSDLRKWNLIPKELALCKACWRYLPHNRIWTTRSGVALKNLKRVDWSWAVMLWRQGGKFCPTCQIPKNSEAGKRSNGTFVQNWAEGMAAKVMVVQVYDDAQS
jgi:hypothetical protein